jgi:hypothetical protein
MVTHPVILTQTARLRHNDLLAEAAHARLTTEARSRPASTHLAVVGPVVLGLLLAVVLTLLASGDVGAMPRGYR